MRRRLPPMNSLRVFEAVARHCSMTAAAVELHVSHSAVSRQITQLETYLQAQLFHRKGRGLTLTRQGAVYAGELKDLFDGIEAATQTSFDSSADTAPLQINLQPSFASRWMAPRLAGFNREYPKIALQLNTVYDNAPADFERSNVDFSICVGDGEWPGVHAIRLFDEILVPACSPTLTGPLENVNDIGKFVLLHAQQRAGDWGLWLRAAGATTVDPLSGLRLGNSHVAIQAATYGLGITMAQAGYVCEDLRLGRLIGLFEQKKLRTNHAFYAVCPMNKRSLSKVSAFCSWLETEARKFRGEFTALFGGPHRA